MSVLTGTPLLPTYARFPVTFVDGDGSWLIADDGQRYLDLVADLPKAFARIRERRSKPPARGSSGQKAAVQEPGEDDPAGLE